MDKNRWTTKLSTFEKYGKDFSLVRLAWLIRLENPKFLGTDIQELIEPEELLMCDIVYSELDLEELGPNNKVKHAELTAKLAPLLRNFATTECKIMDGDALSPEQFWLQAGPILASKYNLQLAALKTGELQSRPKLNRLHVKRAAYFQDVKNLAMFFEDAIFMLNGLSSPCPDRIIIELDSARELEIILDVDNAMKVLNSLTKPLSDRDIFTFVCKAVRSKIDATGVIKFANKKLSLTGISNFKSLESSLAEGRKHFGW